LAVHEGGWDSANRYFASNGHSNIGITGNRYADVSELVAAASALRDAFGSVYQSSG